MMYLLRKYDVAPFGRKDAMFAQCAVRHTSFGVAVIIGRSQHHLAVKFVKRTLANIIQKTRKRCVDIGKNAKKELALLQSFSLLFYFSLDM